MDGTIFKEESQLRFLLWCSLRGIVSPWQALQVAVRYGLYLCGLSRDARSLRRQGFRLFRGMTKTALDAFTKQFVAGFTARIRPGVFPLIHRHREQGHKPVLLTSAADVLAEKVAGLLGINHVIATALILKDGVYTGEIAEPSPWGAGKRILAERHCQSAGIDPRHCYVYTDHISDLPLMKLVGKPIAVNPDRVLRRVAQENKWKLVDLESAIKTG